VNGVYKLVAHRVEGEWRGVSKHAAEKETVPGAKQVFRRSERGTMVGDVIGVTEEKLDGEQLLVPFMRAGEIAREDTLEEIRGRAAAELSSLPVGLRAPSPDPEPPPYPVAYSDRLNAELA
jgi:nicotinate phosphoribosyltransferase